MAQERKGGLELSLGEEQFAVAHQMQVEGKYTKSRRILTGLLKEEGLKAELRIVALNELGLVERMRFRYGAGEKAFREALELAGQVKDKEGQVIAMQGLMDLKRTGNRDPKYGQDLDGARQLQKQAEKVLGRGGKKWTLAKVKLYQEMGLIEMEGGKTGNFARAWGYYGQAELGCEELLKREPDNLDYQDRLARTWTLTGVAYECFGAAGIAVEFQSRAFGLYKELGNVRGMGNAAVSKGRAYALRGWISDARGWQEKGIEVGDEVIKKVAGEELAKLERFETAVV